MELLLWENVTFGSKNNAVTGNRCVLPCSFIKKVTIIMSLKGIHVASIHHIKLEIIAAWVTSTLLKSYIIVSHQIETLMITLSSQLAKTHSNEHWAFLCLYFITTPITAFPSFLLKHMERCEIMSLQNKFSTPACGDPGHRAVPFYLFSSVSSLQWLSNTYMIGVWEGSQHESGNCYCI